MENEDNEESKFEKFKKHLKENWKVYTVGAGGIIIGAAGMAVFLTKKYGMTDDQMYDQVITQFAANIKGNRNNQTINYTQETISIYGNKIGRPGIPVIDTTTNKRYESITLAAEALDLPRAQIDKQLRGKMDHVNGHVFEMAE